MKDNVTSMPPKAEKPVEAKTRIITLTNRAPIEIVEAEWPVIAQGSVEYEHPAGIEDHSVNIRVRRSSYRHIVHASYRHFIDDNADASQMVRVGRVIFDHELKYGGELWRHVQEVGEELRSRIINEKLKRNVTFAVDACFANMKPQTY